MTYSEENEYMFLCMKPDDKLDDYDKRRLAYLKPKWNEECKRREHQRIRDKELEKEKIIFDKIKKDCTFKSTYVRGGISRQNGKRYDFYDIELIKPPLVKIYDNKLLSEIEKLNRLRGRSYNISYYVCYKQELIEDCYITGSYFPGIRNAYLEYLNENFYGKKTEDGIEKWQIDMWDEVFVSVDKYKTKFQIWYDEALERHKEVRKNLLNPPEPESWEKAWIDSIEFESKEQWYHFCEDLRRQPEFYTGIKNHIEYLKEAGKIMGRKFV